MCVVSIIICTRNRADSLHRTLQSILKCEVPGHLAPELLVVDNGSTDGTRAEVHTAKSAKIFVRYVPEPRTGKAFAYNTGIAQARGEILLFTDDDVVVPKNWIREMSTEVMQNGGTAIAGLVKLADSCLREWMSPTHRGFLAETTDPIPGKAAECMIGANMGFPRKVLSSVPFFDVELGPGQLGFGEDSLFSWQISRAGFPIKFGGCVVAHMPAVTRLTSRSWLARAQGEGICSAYIDYHWRHAGRAELLAAELTIKDRIREYRCRIQRFMGRMPSSWAGIPELDGAFRRGYLRYWSENIGFPRKYERFGLKKLLGGP